MKSFIEKAFDWYYEEGMANTNIGNDEAAELFLETSFFKKWYDWFKKKWAKSRHDACKVRGEVAIRWVLNLYSDCTPEEIDEAVNEFNKRKL